MVRALLSSPNGIPDLNTQDLTGETPLHLASKAGHHGIVDVLLSKGANPQLQNVCGYNCLHLATLGDHEKVIRIVAQRARELINVRDMSGLAPIHLALFANKSKSLNVRSQSAVSFKTALNIALFPFVSIYRHCWSTQS